MTEDATAGTAPKRELDLVVAVARDLGIGRGGQLPWRIPEDLKYFKRITTGHAVVMGRKTFESIGRALPNRRNIVVSRSLAARDDVEVAPSLEAALELAWERDAAPKIIGGGEIYRLALPFATRVFLTRVDQVVPGCDTHFPEVRDAGFRRVSAEGGETPGVVFEVYERG